MNANRVLLMQLSERTSAKGNRYLSGWLGRASVVAFQAEEPNKWGNPVWDVFVSEPQPRTDQRPLPLEAGQERDPARRSQAANQRAAELLADYEAQSAAIYKADAEAWRDITAVAKAAVRKADEQVAKIC